MNQFDGDYRHGTFLGWTASHCFFKIECNEINNFGANSYADINGPNTDPHNKAVLCTGRRHFDISVANYNSVYFTGPHSASHPNQPLLLAGQLGVGVGHGGFWNPKSCWDNNLVYGIPNGWNYFGAGLTINPWQSYFSNGIPTWPVHYMHEWYGVQPPSPATIGQGLSWFPDLQSAVDNTVHHYPDGACVTGLTGTVPVPVANPNILQSKKINKRRGLGPCCGQKEIIEDVEEINPFNPADGSNMQSEEEEYS